MEVKYNSVSLGVKYGQHTESPSHYWLYRTEIPLKIISYPYSLRCWIVKGLTILGNGNCILFLLIVTWIIHQAGGIFVERDPATDYR